MSEVRHSIAQLIQALQNGDFQVQNEAAVALGELGREAGESVPALTRALEAEDKYLRSHAAAALGKIGPAARHLGFLQRLRRWFERNRLERPK